MLTYSDIWNQFIRNIGKSGLSGTSTEGAKVKADFDFHLATRYQMILAKMANYMTQGTKTASTVASQQYYAYPPGVVNIEDVVVTIGSVKYPLEVINSQRQWDVLNAIQFQPSAIPQFVLPRRDDFGIWPIPQGIYTITFNYHIRDRNLSVDDYSTGTVTVANGSTTVTGTGTFTAGMVGRWFVVTDTTSADYGYWYRVGGYTSTAIITLEQSWQGTGAAGLTYKIGQCPEIPEEGHVILVDGVTADFYAGYKDDIAQATWFSNCFWTGDGTNTSRTEGDQSIKAGLIGLMNLYSDRNDTKLIRRNPKLSPFGYKAFGTVIS
jgi:hypothetical protein